MADTEKWRAIYEEGAGRKRNKIVIAAVALLAAVSIAGIFIVFSSSAASLEQRLNAALEKSQLRVPAGGALLLEFYDDNGEFTGDRFIATQSGVARYSGQSVDLRIATNIKHLAALEEDFCSAARRIWLAGDYVYEIRNAQGLQKYAGLEKCIRGVSEIP